MAEDPRHQWDNDAVDVLKPSPHDETQGQTVRSQTALPDSALADSAVLPSNYTCVEEKEGSFEKRCGHVRDAHTDLRCELLLCEPRGTGNASMIIAGADTQLYSSTTAGGMQR